MSRSVRALGIAGSLRRNGNSTTLLRAALAGAQQAGATTTLIRLDELILRGCRGCDSCPDDGCRQRDGFGAVHAALALADVWLFAAPVYFDGVSGTFKTFYDRLYWFRRQGTEVRPRLGGPRRGAMIVTYEDPQNAFYEQMAQRLVNYLPGFGGFAPGRVLACSGLGPVGAARSRPDYAEAARALGAQLTHEISSDAP
ncbi:MAG: flavodoxin family protein [Polyangiaceae bacterium]|nr:flavodoxin family protein [Polyangiaceae bacterium]